jgi:hypothetical protein
MSNQGLILSGFVIMLSLMSNKRSFIASFSEHLVHGITDTLDQWLEQPLISLRVLRNVSVIFQEAEIPSNDKCSGAVSIGTRLPFSWSQSSVLVFWINGWSNP